MCRKPEWVHIVVESTLALLKGKTASSTWLPISGDSTFPQICSMISAMYAGYWSELPAFCHLWGKQGRPSHYWALQRAIDIWRGLGGGGELGVG